MNKKRVMIIFILSLVLTLSINLISAQNSLFNQIDLKTGMQKIIDQAVGFFTPVFEVVIGDYSGSEFFFAKVLFLLLLLVVIYIILDKVPIFEGYRGVVMIVSLIVSILSVRFMSENDFIVGLLLPYTTLGIAITTIVPFLIFAYGIHVTGLPGIGRKMAWAFFGIIFIILWIYKSDQINPIGNQIYFWTIILIGGMLICDRRVHAYFRGHNIKDWERQQGEAEINTLQMRLNELIRNGGANPSRTNINERKRIVRRLNKLGFSTRGDALPFA